jgi:ubiquinone/menaquinone biosynthesis C-methylase UbiE
MTDQSDRNSAIREQVGRDWDQVASGWRRWAPQFSGSSWPVTQKLLAGLRLRPGERVLDVGCGIGEPSLQAALHVAPDGSVLGVDLSESMLSVCRERAQKYEIQNVRFECSAVEDLREPVASFDAIVARFSVIFFADVDAGFRRLFELLRPGGRIATATWTPLTENPMFGIIAQQVQRYLNQPAPDPDAPGPMRLAGQGELAAALSRAGFVDVKVEPVRFFNSAPTADEYWTMIQDMSPRLRTQFAALTMAERIGVERGIKAEAEKFRDDGAIRVPAKAQVGVGTKPTG